MMFEVPPKIQMLNGFIIAEWNLSRNQKGYPICILGMRERTIQVSGVFSMALCEIKGNSIDPDNWAGHWLHIFDKHNICMIHYSNGSNIFDPDYSVHSIMPQVSGGDDNITDLKVIFTGRI